jgi:hypothetical protein
MKPNTAVMKDLLEDLMGALVEHGAAAFTARPLLQDQSQ